MERRKIIEVRELVTMYGENRVLDGVTMDVFENEILVILGNSGCGKTTLLKHLIQLYRPVSGRIRIFGEDILAMDEAEQDDLAKRMGVLFQNGALLNSLTIGENVAMPLTQHTDLAPEVIDRLVGVKLELVELTHARHRFPSELSGGMRKRAAMARAISLDPPLLFGDEPSAGLDPITSANLDDLVLKLKAQLNMTIVIVTHELASIHRIADRIIFLDKGKVLYSGSVAEAKVSGVEKVEEFFSIGEHAT